MATIIWIDIETTGLNPQRHALVQVAGIVEVDGVMGERWNLRLRPDINAEIDETALAINGLTREKMAEHPYSAAEGCEMLRGILSKYERYIIAGWRVHFDVRFLCALFDMHGDFPDFEAQRIRYPLLDVAPLAVAWLAEKNALHKFSPFTLGNVADYLRVMPMGELHDADTDVMLTRGVYRKLLGLWGHNTPDTTRGGQ